MEKERQTGGERQTADRWRKIQAANRWRKRDNRQVEKTKTIGRWRKRDNRGGERNGRQVEKVMETGFKRNSKQVEKGRERQQTGVDLLTYDAEDVVHLRLHLCVSVSSHTQV